METPLVSVILPFLNPGPAFTPALREVIVLRELEGLDYAEISLIAAIPLGTVMSRLSRGRARLKALLSQAGVAE